MLGWKGFLYVEKNAEGITIDGSIENPSSLVKSGLVLLGYITLFLFITIRYFKRKDILS
jgi:ABC-type transport system involved in multi-copper enzyme maturation permease subunit